MANAELKKKLDNLVKKTKTSEEGIKFLLDYYTGNLKWSEDEAIKFIIKLFKDGVINEIKIIGKKSH